MKMSNTNADNRSHWVKLCQEWRDTWHEEITDTKEGVNIYKFVDKLNEEMHNDWFTVTDAGLVYYILSQKLNIQDNQKFVLSASQADMGCALPASIGVSLANKTKRILCVTGDGSFNSNLQELAVIKYHNLPIKIFVMNNQGYLSIRNTQEKFYEGRVFGTSATKGLWFPEIEKIAESYEIPFLRITNLEFSLTEIINQPTPTLIEVCCPYKQEVVPSQALKKIDGKNVQAPLEDMFPFMDQDTFEKEQSRALQRFSFKSGYHF